MLLSMFYSDAKANNAKLQGTVILRISNLDYCHAYGVTTILTDTTRLIEIDSTFFYDFEGKEPLKRIMYHELGHALLGLDEGPGIMNDRKTFKKISDKEIRRLFIVVGNSCDFSCI